MLFTERNAAETSAHARPGKASQRARDTWLVWLIGIVTFLVVGPAVAAGECARTVADKVDEALSSRFFWYGSDALSVRIARDGYWYGMGPERSFGDKLFIRSSGFRPGQESGLQVRGTRIDGDSEPAEVSAPTNAHDASFGGWAMLVGVSLPAAGCWEFEVRYLGQELKFVVETRKGKFPQGVAVVQQTLDPTISLAASEVGSNSGKRGSLAVSPRGCAVETSEATESEQRNF